MDAADTLYLQPRDFTGTPQALDTPEGFYPTTGVNSLTADTSEAQGAKILDGAITGQIAGGNVDAANPVVVFGYSQSSAMSTFFVGNPLADLLQPDMTVLVNLGYGSIADGWSQGPANVPTPFEPFPTDLNWSDVLTALVNGVPQGIQAAIADLENPDNYQIPLLRERNSLHPIIVKVMAIHVAEEARHISFADQFLSKRVPQMVRRSRFALSLYGPIVMRVLCQAIVVPSRSFFRKFDIPRAVGKELFFNAPDSRQALRDMYGDVRMLCDDVGLMNPFALLLWRICKINGQPSRYRGEPQRAHLPSPATAA